MPTLLYHQYHDRCTPVPPQIGSQPIFICSDVCDANDACKTANNMIATLLFTSPLCSNDPFACMTNEKIALFSPTNATARLKYNATTSCFKACYGKSVAGVVTAGFDSSDFKVDARTSIFQLPTANVACTASSLKLCLTIIPRSCNRTRTSYEVPQLDPSTCCPSCKIVPVEGDSLLTCLRSGCAIASNMLPLCSSLPLVGGVVQLPQFDKVFSSVSCTTHP